MRFSDTMISMKTSNDSMDLNTEKVTIPATEYAELKFQNDKLKTENDELKERLDWLLERVRLAKKKEFGQSSEKSEYIQLDIFNEAEAFNDEQIKEPELTEIKAYKRKKSKELTSRLPEDLPVEVIECTLDFDDLTCDKCGCERHEIGRTLVRSELKLIPAQASIKEYWQVTYGCRRCENEGTEVPIIKAKVPKAAIKGSFASPEAIAHIATQKFVMGSPLYRQEQELNRGGILLSRQTMSNWLIKATETHLFQIYDKMHEDIKANSVLHADETTLQVLKEPEKKAQSKSYMWLYRTGTENKYPIILYDYQPDRGHKRPRDFLSGYKGYLQVDGYNAYKKLSNDITIIGCFAHARRKFTDALAALSGRPDDDKKKTIAGKGKEYCDALFQIERDIKEMGFDDRKKERQKRAVPILNEFKTWLDQNNASGKSKTGEALTYMRNQWEYLSKYVNDGRLEISNNRAERSIKPFVIGRKNFLFANTPEGARTSAVLYSIIETAKENGLDPYLYLTYIFSKSPNMDDNNVESLLPYNQIVQQNCKSRCTST